MWIDDSGDPFAVPDMPALTQSDIGEWNKMSPFVARPDGAEQAPWWQSLVQYGAIKAIDNTFPNTAAGVQGNTAPGSFAGQNGGTYTQRGSQNAPPVLASGGGVGGAFGMSPMMLLGIVAAVLVALH